MKSDARKPELRLRRRTLGLCIGQGGTVYVADPVAKPACVYAMSGQMFAEALRKKHIVARCWAVSVQRENCLLRKMSLPASDEAEIRRMLEFEVPALMPAPSGDVCYDYLPQREEENGNRQVTVVLVPRARLDEATFFLHEAGIIPERIVPSSLALLAWLKRYHGARLAQGRSMLLCIDRQQCQSIVTNGERLLAAKQIKIAQDSQIDLGILLEDAERSVERVEGPSDAEALDRILFSGRDELVAKLSAQADSLKTDAEGCFPETGGLSAEIEIVHLPGLQEDSDVSEIAALCAFGASIEDQPSRVTPFNLLPGEWLELRRRRRRWVEHCVTFAMAIGVVFLLYAWLLVGNYRLESRLTSILAEIEPIRDVATTLEVKKGQARVIKSQLTGRSLPLEVLHELYRCVPGEIRLSNLTMDLSAGKSELVMKGPANDLKAAFTFPSVLEGSRLFVDVRPEGAQQVSRGQGILTEFSCRCSIKPPTTLGRE